MYVVANQALLLGPPIAMLVISSFNPSKIILLLGASDFHRRCTRLVSLLFIYSIEVSTPPTVTKIRFRTS